MKLSTAAAALLLLSATTVHPFSNTRPIQSLKSRQQNNEERVLLNCNNGRSEDEKNGECSRESRERFGMNILGAISGQFGATKVS